MNKLLRHRLLSEIIVFTLFLSCPNAMLAQNNSGASGQGESFRMLTGSAYLRDYDGNNYSMETPMAFTIIDEDKKEVIVGPRDASFFSANFYASAYEQYNSEAITPDYQGTITIPSEIMIDTNDWYKVVGINAYAFYNIPGITKVKAHCKYLRLIEEHAFEENTLYDSYTSIDIKTAQALTIETAAFANSPIDNSGTTYNACFKAERNCLQNVKIDAPSITIQDRAFYGCEGLQTVDITSSGTINIGQAAFGAMGLLAKANVYYRNVPSLFTREAQDYIHINGRVGEIANNAFQGHVNIKEVVINDPRDDGDIVIGENAFRGLFDGNSSQGIIRITGPISQISRSAFHAFNYDELQRYGGYSASDYTTCLKEITLTNTDWFPFTIADSAFVGLFQSNSLQNLPGEITVNGHISKIGDHAFSNWDGNWDDNYDSRVRTINIYNKTTNAEYLRDATLYSKPLDIGNRAFCEIMADCAPDMPGTLNIEGFISTINEEAFYGCYNLSHVNIQNTYNEQDVYINGTKQPTGLEIASNAFYNSYGNTATPATLTIDGDLKSIGYYAFTWCKSLMDVSITNRTIIDSFGNDLTISDYASLYCWQLDGTTRGKLHIDGRVTSIGMNAFRYGNNLMEVKINNTSTTPLTIGNWAFAQGFKNAEVQNSLISLTGSISTIYPYAFQYNDYLDNLTIDNTGTKALTIGNRAFQYCFQRQAPQCKIDIKGNLAEFDTQAFYHPTYVKEVKINNTGSTPLTIGTTCFDYPFNCPGNVGGKVDIRGNLSIIGERSFGSGFALNDTYIENTGSTDLTIGYAAFRDAHFFGYNGINPSPAKIVIKGRLGRIENEAFSFYTIPDNNYGNIESVVIENTGPTPLVIGDDVFKQQYDNLSVSGSCSISGRLASIGNNAFKNTNNLVTLDINTTSDFTIGTSCFENSVRLSAMNTNNGQNTSTVPPTVSYIGNSAFQNTGFTEITIPLLTLKPSRNPNITASKPMQSVTVDGTTAVPASDTDHDVYNINSNLGNMMFAYCQNLTTATVNNTATGAGVFANCRNLSDVTLGNDVLYIETQAFMGCTQLSKLTVPENVRVVGSSIMSNGANPHRITFESAQPPFASYYAFDGYNPNIVVPKGSVSAYLFSHDALGFQRVPSDNISCEYKMPASGWGTLGMQPHTTKEYQCAENNGKITSLDMRSQRGTFTDIYDVRRVGLADANDIATTEENDIKIYTSDNYYPDEGYLGIDLITQNAVVNNCLSTTDRNVGYLVNGIGGETYYLHHFTGGDMNSTASVDHNQAGYDEMVTQAETIFNGEDILRPGRFGGGTYKRSVAPNLMIAYQPGMRYTQGQDFRIDSGNYHGTVPCYFYFINGGKFYKIGDATWDKFKEGTAIIVIPVSLLNDAIASGSISSAGDGLGVFAFEYFGNGNNDPDDAGGSGSGATSINSVNADTTESGRWYTLDGRLLNEKPVKQGIYIYNNRKVVIR